MKTNLKVFLIAFCAGGMVTAQAQTVVNSFLDIPSGYRAVDVPPGTELPDVVKQNSVTFQGKLYVDPKYYHTYSSLGQAQEATGVAAGSQATANSAAAGSTAVIIALGVGVFAVIGAIIAGSTSNTTTATVSTVTTHK